MRGRNRTWKQKAAMAGGFLLSVALSLSACGAAQTGADEADAGQQESASVETASNDAVTGEITALSEEESETLTFVDAHGEWYTVDIRDDVEPHDYDWDSLSGSGLTLSYEDDTYTSRVGVDVSQYQGEIDWQAVREAGVTFAFVRIGGRGYGEEGTLYADERASENIAGAQAAGLDVGVYFFSQAVSEQEAVEEAEFVLDLLGDAELTLPVVYDPESILDDTARTDDVSGEQFTRNTLAFCDRIREAGYTPMVYCNMLWEAYELDLAALQEADLTLWYADYEPQPQTPYAFSIWQYAEDARVDGIEGDADLDLMIDKK